MVVGAKKRGEDPERVMPGVKIEGDEVVEVRYPIAGAEIIVKADSSTSLEVPTAAHGMTRVNPRTGEVYALIVDEGWEGVSQPADGTPGELEHVEKEISLSDLFERGLRGAEGQHRIILDKEASPKGYYYGLDSEDGMFLGKNKGAALKALKGPQVAVADALKHQYGDA
jgi:hypothetical protein